MSNNSNKIASVDISIRDGGESDIDFLSAAHRAGHEAVRDERGGKLDILLRGRAEPIEDSFRASLLDASTQLIVAEANSLPIGYLVCQIEELRNGELVARVTDLWVHPESRGVGAGAALMREASNRAVKAGCVGIDARALPGDRVTKNFFESFGLVARTIEVHKSL